MVCIKREMNRFIYMCLFLLDSECQLIVWNPSFKTNQICARSETEKQMWKVNEQRKILREKGRWRRKLKSHEPRIRDEFCWTHDDGG